MGADDYLIKPFGTWANFWHACARPQSKLTAKKAESTFEYQGLFVDMAKRLVSIDEVEVHLTPKEYDLLKYDFAAKSRSHSPAATYKSLGAEYSEDTPYA